MDMALSQHNNLFQASPFSEHKNNNNGTTTNTGDNNDKHQQREILLLKGMVCQLRHKMDEMTGRAEGGEKEIEKYKAETVPLLRTQVNEGMHT